MAKFSFNLFNYLQVVFCNFLLNTKKSFILFISVCVLEFKNLNSGCFTYAFEKKKKGDSYMYPLFYNFLFSEYIFENVVFAIT